MDANDFYKLKAEDYDRNFHSLRSIEWRLNFQVYAGYAAIAVVYWHLHAKYGSSKAIGLSAIAATVLLFGATTYFYRRLTERLHFTRDMQNAYLEKIRQELGAENLDLPKGTREPIHKRWYAFVAQTVLSSATAIALLAFEFATTCP